MAILSSALKTLSEMAHIDQTAQIPKYAHKDAVQELLEYVNELPSLTEGEMRFTVDMIPVRKSNRLGKYLIEAEDLSRYMMTNRIHSPREAINNILEANDIVGQFHRIAVIIDEASILDEVESIGYNVSIDNWDNTPKPGLGMPLFGNKQKDFQYLRRVANTKEMMDMLTGRYGIPLIKKNYKQVGLLENDDKYTEDVKIKPPKDSQILQEKPNKNKEEEENKKNMISENATINEESYNNNYEEEINDNNNETQESLNEDNMSDYEKHIQYLRDIQNGKYDDEYNF